MIRYGHDIVRYCHGMKRLRTTTDRFSWIMDTWTWRYCEEYWRAMVNFRAETSESTTDVSIKAGNVTRADSWFAFEGESVWEIGKQTVISKSGLRYIWPTSQSLYASENRRRVEWNSSAFFFEENKTRRKLLLNLCLPTRRKWRTVERKNWNRSGFS